VAVITGAGSGMARASTRVFVREGARALAADISGRKEETAAELGDAVVPFGCDVTKEDQVEGMFAAALDAFGSIDAVLNVAGIGSAGPLADVTMDEYDRLVSTTRHAVSDCVPPVPSSIRVTARGSRCSNRRASHTANPTGNTGCVTR
jgi:NAD(P)-dependent dehydrogenase (short-subunit alcohol dehydrogenase family)